jgi:hypothetical protein
VPVLTAQDGIVLLEESAEYFEAVGDATADEKERAAMYLVARCIRNTASYAVAAGHARLHRAEMERRAAMA